MIVLDEHLGNILRHRIERWYRGRVSKITELRPGSITKDEAIPSLLTQQRSPTFVTLNERDFWRRVEIDQRFCVVCYVLDEPEVNTLEQSLRSVLRHPRFRTKARCMGCVIRVSGATITYYRHNDLTVRILD